MTIPFSTTDSLLACAVFESSHACIDDLEWGVNAEEALQDCDERKTYHSAARRRFTVDKRIGNVVFERLSRYGRPAKKALVAAAAPKPRKGGDQGEEPGDAAAQAA
ncbi:hypothetical protein [Bradyrhizobium sp.]|uniref:hypothetical protein n=1 Tax=Bradyrhizobium sp. TaxID=376 RepID=UPI00239BA51F|nr:hypothetical protein [Bradyrhizobium sp.]MDE2378926.1 hypothetical protein [Bradyrhizobium sp.]